MIRIVPSRSPTPTDLPRESTDRYTLGLKHNQAINFSAYNTTPQWAQYTFSTRSDVQYYVFHSTTHMYTSLCCIIKWAANDMYHKDCFSRFFSQKIAPGESKGKHDKEQEETLQSTEMRADRTKI